MSRNYNSPTIEEDIGLFLADLTGALEYSCLYMEDEIRTLTQLKMEENVYNYKPTFDFRRKDFDDPDSLFNSFTTTDKNVYANGEGFELNIELTAPWQQLRSGEIPNIPLADAVESGYAMYGAGARPFTDEVDADLQGGIGDNMLTTALNFSGLVDATRRRGK